jgi:hypothetical protein
MMYSAMRAVSEGGGRRSLVTHHSISRSDMVGTRWETTAYVRQVWMTASTIA